MGARLSPAPTPPALLDVLPPMPLLAVPIPLLPLGPLPPPAPVPDATAMLRRGSISELDPLEDEIEDCCCG